MKSSAMSEEMFCFQNFYFCTKFSVHLNIFILKYTCNLWWTSTSFPQQIIIAMTVFVLEEKQSTKYWEWFAILRGFLFSGAPIAARECEHACRCWFCHLRIDFLAGSVSFLRKRAERKFSRQVCSWNIFPFIRVLIIVD